MTCIIEQKIHATQKEKLFSDVFWKVCLYEKFTFRNCGFSDQLASPGSNYPDSQRAVLDKILFNLHKTLKLSNLPMEYAKKLFQLKIVVKHCFYQSGLLALLSRTVGRSDMA